MCLVSISRSWRSPLSSKVLPGQARNYLVNPQKVADNIRKVSNQRMALAGRRWFWHRNIFNLRVFAHGMMLNGEERA